jgi:predicted HTH domain antitoxin
MSSILTIEVPAQTAQLLGKADETLGREVFVAAVLRWFEEGLLSQGQAATILGLKRGEFFQLLNDRRVSPIQMDVTDLEEDFRRG